MSEYEARQALQRVFDQLERRQQVRRGLLGDSNGVVMVANRNGWAYIRYHENLNELAIVRYLIEDQLPDGTPVVVGRKHPDDPFEQVLGVDWALYAWSPSASNVNQHTTPAIDLSHLSPGKVVPTDPASLLVSVRAFLYVNGDSAVEFGGGTIDLTGNVPGVAGHRLVLVYVDLDVDSLAAEDGDIVAVGTDADAPAVPENGLPLGVVDLANGETTIEAGDISQYKALYLVVGEVIDLTQLSDYARGFIIRGGATDWEAYDANDDGAALYGDGTDILSSTTPTWKGTHTWTPGDDEAIVLEMDAAQTADIFQVKDSGGDVTSGFDERGIVFSDGDTSSTNFFGGADAGRSAATGAYNVGVGHDVMQALTSGYGNVGAGDEALYTLTSGYSNIALGKGALYSSADGTHSIAIGTSALYTSASDDDNVVVGSTAGFNLDGANRVIFIGRDAGFRQTNASDRLLIDNQRRADIATELTHSILYGTMAANPEDQQLTINVDSLTVGTDADADVVMNWVANSNSGVLTWMEDEDYFRFGDTVDLNHVGLQRIYQQTVTVAKAGGDYTSIQDAIDYAVTQTPSTSNRFCILIHPGDYAETIVGADYVELMGLAAREAVNITGATGPLYTFPDNEGHIFNLKFSLSPTTDAQVIIDVPATVAARQVISNCLFTVTSASDVATYVFDIKAGEIECINNKVIFSNTNTAGGAIRSQRIWNVSGDAIVDLYGNIVDVDIYDVNDRVYIYTDASLAGGEIHIKENVIRVNSHNAGAYSGVVSFILYTGATTTLHVAHNFVELTSAETAGTGTGTFVRSNSAGSGLIRSTANHVIVQGFATNYWASVAAGDTIVSHFDNVVAVDGGVGAGTLTYANSQADGDLNVSGAAHFGTGTDMDIYYDGTDGYIRTDLVAASDLHIDCGSQKTLELQTSVYNDVFLPVAITKPGGTAPSWTSFFGNLSQYTFAIDDYVQGSFELPHDYKEGTDVDVHVHIVTQGAEAAVEVRYSFEYWIADMGEASVATTTITSADYTLTNANGHHEYVDIGDITGAGYRIGAVVCFLFKRVALVGGSDPSNDPFVVSIGCHYEVDTLGSRQETVK